MFVIFFYVCVSHKKYPRYSHEQASKDSLRWARVTTNSWIKRLLCLLRRSRFERHFKRFTRYVGRLFITGGRAYKKNTYWKISQKQKSYEAYRSSFQKRTVYLTISLGVCFLIDFVRLLFTLMLASIRFMMSNIWSNSRSYKKKRNGRRAHQYHRLLSNICATKEQKATGNQTEHIPLGL